MSCNRRNRCNGDFIDFRFRSPTFEIDLESCERRRRRRRDWDFNGFNDFNDDFDPRFYDDFYPNYYNDFNRNRCY